MLVGSDSESTSTAQATGVPTVLRALRRPSTGLAVLFLVMLAAVAVFAPLFAPHSPYEVRFDAVYATPNWSYLLGGDELGRDVLSRLIFGARTSLLAGLQAVAVSLVLGVPPGLFAGYHGGRLDNLLNRLNDGLMTVPSLILALAIVAVLGPGLGNAMFAVGVAFTPRVFRVVRAAAADVRHQPFIEAATSLGCSPSRIMGVHIFPNVLSPLLVVVSVSLGTGVLAEASLSFLGLGAAPPAASWGGMIALAAKRLDLRYLILPPGLALMFTVAAFMVVGDAIRDAVSSRREQSDGL